MPWETASGEATVEIPIDPGPFSHTVKIQVAAQQPSALAFYNQNYKLLPDSNASPGDVIIAYLAGLGPTDVSVPDGNISPSNPLSRLILPITASWDAGSGTVIPAAVYYAGLAPGLIGVYQVNI